MAIFDSNVVLYLALSSGPKSLRAGSLMAQGGAISVQVLNECANVLRTKQSQLWSEVYAFLYGLRMRFKLHPVTVDLHQNGLHLAERYGFAVYDSFIVAAALAAGCDTLWSEDMQDGMVADGRLTITNPFSTPLAS
ncbi:MAG: PIN domain-containing protein [Tardiphaga sp.]